MSAAHAALCPRARRAVRAGSDFRCLWGNLAQGGPTCAETPIQIRSAVSLDGSTWTRQATAGCQPLQIDRPWVAAYTPPAFRNTPQASSHTSVYYEYHDFGLSNIWVES